MLVKNSVMKKRQCIVLSGKGWYRYSAPGSKTPYVDDETVDILKKHRQELGIEPRTISTQVGEEKIEFLLISNLISREATCVWVYRHQGTLYDAGASS